MNEFQELNEKLDKVEMREDSVGDEIAKFNVDPDRVARRSDHGEKDEAHPDVSTTSIYKKVEYMFEDSDFKFIDKQRSAAGIHYEFESLEGQIVKVYIADKIKKY